MKFGRFRFFEKFVVNDETDGQPYLIRWRLIETPWFGVFLHHILRSDRDRATHDHPWGFVSVILSGGYTEHSQVRRPHGATFTKHYRAGSIVRHKATDLHRLELDRPAWTLVFIGARCREWGFMTPRGWVHWEQYLATPIEERNA